MVGVANLDGAGVRIIGVGVMPVDQTPAWPDLYSEEQADGALLTRQLAEGTLVVNLSLHVT